MDEHRKAIEGMKYTKKDLEETLSKSTRLYSMKDAFLKTYGKEDIMSRIKVDFKYNNREELHKRLYNEYMEQYDKGKAVQDGWVYEAMFYIVDLLKEVERTNKIIKDKDIYIRNLEKTIVDMSK